MVTTDKISEDVYFVKRYLNNGELEPILFEELYVNAQGIKNGSYIKYESNGFKKQEGSYRNDKKEGIWTYYADNTPTREGQYEQDNRVGQWKNYYNFPNYTNLQYKDGQLYGSFESKHKNGNLSYRAHYTNQGVLDGANTSYYEDGKTIRLHRDYYLGKIHGIEKQYYQSGQLKLETKYTNGEIDGELKSFHENGQLAAVVTYQNNNIVNTLLYDEKGMGIPIDTNRTTVYQDSESIKEFKTKVQNKLNQFIQVNFKYPGTMQRIGAEARVFVNFEINSSGDLTILGMRSDQHPMFVEATKQLFSLLNEKFPFTYYKIEEKIRFTLPILYNLSD